MWPFRRKSPPTRATCPAAESGPADGSARNAADGGTDQEDRPLGPLGEKLACRFLRKMGMKILAQNYRCPSGELDLIALDRSTGRKTGSGTIVFGEVKTRSCDRYTDPESAVDAEKRRRMRKAADYYLATHDAGGFAVRFDVIAIVAQEGKEPRLKHIPGAF